MSASEVTSPAGRPGEESGRTAEPRFVPKIPKDRIVPRRRHIHAMYVTAGFFALYLGGIVTAPYFITPDSVDFGEDGLSGRIEFEDARRGVGMRGFLYALYWEGDLNHHQKASRSYFLIGNEMPQDTRDLGIYAGLMAALLFTSRRMYRIKAWGLLLGLVPIGLDGGVQLLTDFVTINPFRVYTGFLCGLTVGLAFSSIYHDTLAPNDMQVAQKERARMSDEEKKGGAALRRARLGGVLTLFEPLAKIFWRWSGLERGDREFFALCITSILLVVGHVLVFKFGGVQLYRSGW